jgi:hypothetical protein
MSSGRVSTIFRRARGRACLLVETTTHVGGGDLPSLPQAPTSVLEICQFIIGRLV